MQNRTVVALFAWLLFLLIAPSWKAHSSPGVGDSVGAAKGVLAYADTNRDGSLDSADIAGRERASVRQGALVVANLDDDDRDGRPDAWDDVVNGEADLADLARGVLRIDRSIHGEGTTFVLRVPPEARAFVRVFGFVGGRWKTLDNTNVTPFSVPSDGVLPLRIEATTFAGAREGWSGLADLQFVARAPNGDWLEADTLRVRVAPFLMLPNSARTQRLYASSGVYANGPFLSAMEALAGERGVPFTVHRTDVWQEMWMQDTMEIGYTQIPGGPVMHMTLGGLRGFDSFPSQTLAPGVGYLEVADDRGLEGSDAWADWYGNLEVSAPTRAWPLGRIYYGHNTITGVTFHPEVVRFLAAQELQAPFSVDTSWLSIKHVDEIFNFVVGSNGLPRILVASPRAASAFYPDEYGPYNQGLQVQIDAIVTRATEALGLDRTAVISLPVLFEEGHNVWSNPVNGVFLNGTAVMGATYLPQPVKDSIAAKFSAIGISSHFVDDAAYQDNLGNVHCATNTQRVPPVAAWWAPR